MDVIDFWKIPNKKCKNPDCFVILSYAVKDKKEPTKPTKNLIRTVYRLSKKYPGAKVIMSTGDNQGLGVSNAKVMAKYGIKLGIPKEVIILEDQSSTTYENLIFTKHIVERGKLKRPCLVVFDLHARRVIATAKKLGWNNISWVLVYSKGEPAYGFKRIQTYSRLTIILYEIVAMLYSRVRGWI